MTIAQAWILKECNHGSWYVFVSDVESISYVINLKGRKFLVYL